MQRRERGGGGRGRAEKVECIEDSIFENHRTGVSPIDGTKNDDARIS